MLLFRFGRSWLFYCLTLIGLSVAVEFFMPAEGGTPKRRQWGVAIFD
jgi:hypothetical protein